MMRAALAGVLIALAGAASHPASSAPAKPAAATRAEPLQRLETPDFSVALRAGSQTLVSLAPKGGKGFDFAPFDRLAARTGNGFYDLGDIDLRLRAVGSKAWSDYSTALRRAPIRKLPTAKGVLAAADLGPSLPANIPLSVERRWLVDGGRLVLRYRLTNRSARPVEIGGLGIPLVFNNIITDRTLEQAHEKGSFYDPYVGRDAGYLQVTRLNGRGPALLVLPDGQTPFELYKPILDTKPKEPVKLYHDRTPRGLTFEGFYNWMVASRGFAETDWRNASQWNEPTSIVLAPGESREIGLRFVLSPSIRKIEETLLAARRPVAVGLPGYIVPTDLDADLFLKTPSPVKSVAVFPSGALRLTKAEPKNGWTRYKVRGLGWGRARVTLTYENGETQTVHYFVTKPSAEVTADLGRFLTTKQWFDRPNDPFGRSPSVMGYDRETDKIVEQDERVWIAGLGDEGGGGAWLAAIMKQLDNPEPGELAKLERFATEVLDGRLQINEGPEKYGVRKSLFYFDKANPAAYDPAIDWSTWASWDRKQADSVVRSFNYVHVAAAHWVLYRLARNHEGLVKNRDWRWHLERAFQTVLAMPRLAPHYAGFGQMEGDVFVDILKDLKREGMTAQAAELDAAMRKRADHWIKDSYPFGSEMPWDSTGQEEVYAWMRWFGQEAKAAMTREVILAYDPLVPHWGYNGSARRYWDFLYAGKTKRVERQLHHYGSTLNAIPLFDSFRRDPSDIHLLRAAYGGLMGGLTNIDRDGFGSAAFHSFPDMMRWDGYSGDYGMSFFGHAYAAATYLVDDPQFGWIGFGGQVEERGDTVTIEPRDSARTRLFVAPLALWLTLDAGKFDRAELNRKTGELRILLDPADRFTPKARLTVATTAPGRSAYRLDGNSALEAGAYSIPLSARKSEVRLAPVS